MSFSMIDCISGWDKGKRIEALKTLSMCEEYLADHFPAFPVMPGVLMLEAMVQTGAWLLRLSSGLYNSIYLLREVKTIRYGSFVKPGDVLRLQVELLKSEGALFTFKGKGMVGDKAAVTGRFILAQKSLGEFQKESTAAEEKLARFFQEKSSALMECARGA